MMRVFSWTILHCFLCLGCDIGRTSDVSSSENSGSVNSNAREEYQDADAVVSTPLSLEQCVEQLTPCPERHEPSTYELQVFDEIRHEVAEAKLATSPKYASLWGWLTNEPLPPNVDAFRINISHHPRAPLERSKGQRVLILDGPLRQWSLLRFRGRLLEYLTFDQMGNYRTLAEYMPVFRFAERIEGQLLGERLAWTHNSRLHPINGALKEYLAIKKRYEPEREDGTGHAAVTVALVLDYNPDAEFALAEMPNTIQEPLLTYIRNKENPEGLAVLREFFSNMSRSLINKIKELEINFIVLPAGYDKIDPRLAKIVLENYLRPLASIPGVIFVQSGPYADHPTSEGDPPYLTDCATLPNRLRVGYALQHCPGIPKSGTNEVHLLPKKQANGFQCIDVFINNSGLDHELEILGNERPPYGFRGADSYGGYGATGISTSIAAPIGLSYLIYLKNHVLPANASVEDLLRAANNNGRGKIIDPLFYGQFEKCHLQDY